MYPPSTDDEITGLARYADLQLEALRAAVVGLTEEQAREQPCRSTLSLGGLLKHTLHGIRRVTERLEGDPATPPVMDETAFATYLAGFALTDEETTAGLLVEFDEARVAFVAAIEATDPATPTVEPPAPWDGIFDARPANRRYLLVHQVEELARHAGHADILREQIDGTSVPAIVLTLAGMPAGDFFQPYAIAPGTIGAPPA